MGQRWRQKKKVLSGPPSGRRRPLAPLCSPPFAAPSRAASAFASSAKGSGRQPSFFHQEAARAALPFTFRFLRGKEGRKRWLPRACAALLSRAQGRCSPHCSSTEGARMGASIVRAMLARAALESGVARQRRRAAFVPASASRLFKGAISACHEKQIRRP
ncbi:hypothetical protein HPB50_003829 [Hyalomma asiaticum]|uniref:Uncharacterized protein n=1 Tax=Hyalomma asiaticum TaxID=266040 RepID=A0ACB7TER4_HYAAI|nr:hypothetical protein HPB50_003829 [Hyalomma asiaticum]